MRETEPFSQESRTPVRTSDKAAPRDQRLVHRMSQMTLEVDLPGDLEYITSPRMSQMILEIDLP